jgi:hypothetical protein
VAGEYCPGAHSVNARGRRKLMGVGQRLVSRAAHVGGVIVVHDAARLREGLTSVYDPLGYAFDPEAAGALEDEADGIACSDVVEALLAAWRRRRDVIAGALDDALLARAAELEVLHRIGDPPLARPRGDA